VERREVPGYDRCELSDGDYDSEKEQMGRPPARAAKAATARSRNEAEEEQREEEDRFVAMYDDRSDATTPSEGAFGGGRAARAARAATLDFPLT